MSVLKQLIASRQGLLYEGKHVVAIVSPAPSVPGQIWVCPREAYPTLDAAPDFVVGEMFSVASKVSMALFEGLGVHGTTVILQNGLAAGQRLAHVLVSVMPRQENDGLQLDWERKQLDEEAMATVELKLKPELKNVGIFEGEKAKPVEAPKTEEVSDDWLKESLRRIP